MHGLVGTIDSSDDEEVVGRDDEDDDEADDRVGGLSGGFTWEDDAQDGGVGAVVDRQEDFIVDQVSGEEDEGQFVD